MSDKISIIRGDDVTFDTTFKDSDSVAINLTGATVFFTVKERLEDSDDDAVITKDITSHTDPTNGITQITLTHIETGALAIKNYYYDIQLLQSGGAISSIDKGLFEVKEDVTQRII